MMNRIRIQAYLSSSEIQAISNDEIRISLQKVNKIEWQYIIIHTISNSPFSLFICSLCNCLRTIEMSSSILHALYRLSFQW